MITKKIVHILYSGLGGTTDYVFNLIRADENMQYEHFILFYGIENVPVPQFNLAEKLASNVFFIKKKRGIDTHSQKQVFKQLCNITPDVIILNINSLIFTCSKYKGSKLFFVEHQANHLKTKKEWLWSILAQKYADKVICLTDDYQKILKEKLKFLYQPHKNVVVKTGINLDDFKSTASHENSKINIGMISRINSLRDHENLIKGFNLLNHSNIELHIAGDGPLLEKLKNKFSNITFHGNIKQKNIPAFLASLDIYVHASYGETSSVAIMQAQASGLPIIATNVKGINNVLTEDICIFAEASDPISYKNALTLLIENEKLRRELAQKSLIYAKKHLSHYKMFEAYQKIIKS